MKKLSSKKQGYEEPKTKKHKEGKETGSVRPSPVDTNPWPDPPPPPKE